MPVTALAQELQTFCTFTIFSGLFTSINPSYFDVNKKRGTLGFDTPKSNVSHRITNFFMALIPWWWNFVIFLHELTMQPRPWWSHGYSHGTSLHSLVYSQYMENKTCYCCKPLTSCSLNVCWLTWTWCFPSILTTYKPRQHHTSPYLNRTSTTNLGDESKPEPWNFGIWHGM